MEMEMERERKRKREMDYLDGLPDHLLLHILNYVSSQDFNSLVRCSAVSRRFRLLVPLVTSVLIHLDCFVLFDDPAKLPPLSVFSIHKPPPLVFSRSPLASSLIRSLVSKLLLLLHPPVSSNSLSAVPPFTPSSSPPIVHRTPPHAIKNFPGLRTIRFVFPSGELCLGEDSSAFLCWRAHFGSSLKRCLILAAATSTSSSPRMGSTCAVAEDKDAIPDSLRTALCRSWTISSLSSASKRQSKLWPIIVEHTTIENLVVDDADGQGVLLMDRAQLEELRKEQETISKRRGRTTKVTPVRMWEWFAPVVELSSGVVLKGAMVVAVLPMLSDCDMEEMVLGWIEEELDGMHAEAIRMLVKGRTRRYQETSFRY